MNKTALLELLHQKALQTGIGERTQALARGFGWTMPSAMYSRVVCGITTILAARAMGPSDFGLANLALATTLWVQVPLFMGIPTAILHFTPKTRHEDKPAWILHGMRLLFLFGAATLLIGYALSPLWSYLQGVATIEFNAGLLWCLGFFFHVCAITAFNAQENFKARGIAEIVFATVFPSIVIWSIAQQNLTWWLYVAALAVGYGVTGLFGLAWNFRGLRLPPPLPPQVRASSELLRYGLLASIGGVASALFLAPQRIVANQYLSLTDVGILSAYQSGSIQMAAFILGISSQVFFPIASRTPDKELLFKKLVRLMLASGPVLFAGLVGFLAIYFLILGESYPWHGAETIAFCAASLLTLFNGILGWYLASFGERGLISASVIGLVAGIANIAGCFLLIPDWKILGAGIAGVISAGLAMIICCLPKVREYARRDLAA